MNFTDSDDCLQPLELEARADELDAEAASLRAKAKRMRLAQAAEPVQDSYVTKARPHRSGVPFYSLLEAAKRGELAKLKAGRAVAFLASDVDAWLASRASRPKPKTDLDLAADAAVRRLVGGAA